MTDLRLITDGGRAGSAPAPRRTSRPRARLKLVADAGAAPRDPGSTGAGPRRHSALTLAVAAAAIAAAGLTTAAFDRDPGFAQPPSGTPSSLL